MPHTETSCVLITIIIIVKTLSEVVITPVGTVSCERSFSALRRLKIWTRSPMTKERLSGLAVMLMHRGTNDMSLSVSLAAFSVVPDLLFDCSRVLEYAKIRTVAV